MNALLRPLCFVLLASTLVLSMGCSPKPRRDPSQTVLGQPNTGLSGGVVGDFGAGGSFGAGPSDLAPGTTLSERGGVIETDDMIRGLLEPVLFAFDQSAIAPEQRPKLDAAKAYLDANPQRRLLVEGRCDWRGTGEYNLGLGDRRAASVRQYLVTLGVSADRIESISKGDLEATENASDEVMARDRRADLVILKR